MTTIAPGGALDEGPAGPRALLPGFGPLRPMLRPVLGPVVRPVRPVLGPVVRAALPAHLRARPLLPPVPRRVPVPPAPPADAAPDDDLPASSRPSLPRRLVLVVPVAATGAAVAALAVALSPAGAVRTVEVHGASPRWAAAVRAAASTGVGGSTLLVDTAGVAVRVAAVPGVRSASVGVRWPGTLIVDVEERVPAAAVQVAGGLRLVDAAGVDLGVAGQAPAALPRIAAGPARGAVPARLDGAAVAAALAARGRLPAPLAAEVTAFGATSPDGVWFGLRDGAHVVWGSPERSADKAAVLAALRAAAPHALRYDVSAPDTPAVATR